MKNKLFGVCLFVFFCVGLAVCKNPVMETWWDRPEPRSIEGVYYEVEFQANEGLPIPGIQHIAHNERVMKVQAMTRDGYAFGGWYTDSSFNNEWDFSENRVTSNLTLHARWVQIGHGTTYTVTFVADTEVSGVPRAYPAPPPQVVVAGFKVTEPAAMRKGISLGSNTWFGFGGWYTDNDSYINEWNFNTDRVNSDMTLYAKWADPPHCIVTFEPYAGNPIPRTQDLLNGTKIIEPFAMNNAGYGFGGWFTDTAFSPESQWDFETRVGSQNITLYAKWVTNYYTVTYEANGGAPAPARQSSVAHGTLLTSPQLMRKSGEGFLGWFTDPNFAPETQWNFAEDTVTRDGIVLYAKWGDAHYTVKFDLKLPPFTSISQGTGGHLFLAAPEDQELALGSKISEPFLGNINGWSFYGWTTSSIPASDFNGATESHRNTLTSWDFDKAVTEDDFEANLTLTLYARWVENVPDMVWVRKGSFTMGAAGAGTSPARPVKFETGFYMAKYLVTQNAFHNAINSDNTEINKMSTHYITTGGPSGTSGGPGSSTPSQFKANQPTRPVDRVSWFDAVVYSNIRSIEDGLTPVYSIDGITNPNSWPGTITWNVNASTFPESWNDIKMDPNANGYRLPTEAEWEYAARGGNGSPGDFTYSGSNIIEDVAWFNTNSGSQTHPVGTKLPNGLGIYDMSGNVMEWCWDWYDSKYYSAANNNVDPKGPDSGTERVRRGGSWNNAINSVRTVARASFVPNNNTWVMGIRVVRGIETIY